MTTQERQIIAKIALHNKNTKIGQKLAKIIVGRGRVGRDSRFYYGGDGRKLVKEIQRDMDLIVSELDAGRNFDDEDDVRDFWNGLRYFEHEFYIENISEDEWEEIDVDVEKLQTKKVKMEDGGKVQLFVSHVEYAIDGVEGTFDVNY